MGPFSPQSGQNYSVPPYCFGGPFLWEVLGPIGFFVDFENYEAARAMNSC